MRIGREIQGVTGMMVALTLAVSLIISGCASPQPEVGVGVDYQFGNTHGLLPVPRDDAADAAQRVIGELGFEHLTRRTDAGNTVIRGENEAGRSVKITVRFQGEKASEMWVGMDVLGDQELSNTIFTRIQQQLEIKPGVGERG